jgi:hypothetical protein
MGTRGLALVTTLAIAAAGTVGLAQPAGAAQITVGSAPCSATLTVVPGDIEWGPGYGPLAIRESGWLEIGNVTAAGSCQPGATAPVVATGMWERFGSSRDSVTGECPPAEFSLQSTQTGTWTDYYEMTNEYAGVQGAQLLGIDPSYTPPVPFGTDGLTTPVPTGGVAVGQTDAAACASWPTAPSPPQTSFPQACGAGPRSS